MARKGLHGLHPGPDAMSIWVSGACSLLAAAKVGVTEQRKLNKISPVPIQGQPALKGLSGGRGGGGIVDWLLQRAVQQDVPLQLISALACKNRDGSSRWIFVLRIYD
jgi:hypothetical protein